MLDSPLDGIRSPFGVRRGRAFSPSTLFALAEPGVWFDPSDLTTLFTDPAGTTPVTAPGNTVGLMLDKSRGLALGSELVVNGDFASSANWTAQAGWAVSGGKASASASNAAIYQALAGTVNGARYRVTFTVSDYVSGSVYIALRGGQTPNISSNGTFTALVGPTSGSDANCYVAATSNFTGSIDNVSVRELAGNHATQATLAARPTYSIEPVGGRRNLLLWSEDFRTTAQAGETRPWTHTNATVTPNAAVAPDGTTTATRIQLTTGTAYSSLVTQGGLANQPSAFVTFSAYVWCASGTQKVTLGITQAGVLNHYSGYKTITTTPTRIDFTVQFSAGGSGADVRFVAGADGIGADFFVWHPQFELGSTATNYQKVTTQYDVTEAGVASVGYLYFDGVNDAMATSTITPGIDKAQVFAGVRKVSDAATGMLVELSTTFGNAGSFAARAPRTPAEATFDFNSGGTVSRSAVSPATYAAPTTNVLTGLGDIGGDLVTLRLNGTQVGQVTADQGTGNYLAYPLYIGARAGTSLFFLGHLYSLITRFGPTLDAPTISNTETWVAGKTGFYTPIITGVPTIGVS